MKVFDAEDMNVKKETMKKVRALGAQSQEMGLPLVNFHQLRSCWPELNCSTSFCRHIRGAYPIL